MLSRTHVPVPPLQPFVARAQGYAVGPSPTAVHRGLPSRHLTLVIDLTAPLRVAREGDGTLVQAHVVVGGLHTSAMLIDSSRPQEGVQYDLTALGARALLGLPPAALRGQAVDAVDLVGAAGRRLLDQLRGESRWPERFALLDAFLLERLGHSALAAAGPPDEVAEAWRLTFAHHGRLRIAALAAHVGWSRRHLGEQFRAATGLTPKEAARIARFEAARALLVAAKRPSLVDVATRSGYADQPHLAREWRALAGCSVGTWLREELPFVQDKPAEP